MGEDRPRRAQMDPDRPRWAQRGSDRPGQGAQETDTELQEAISITLRGVFEGPIAFVMIIARVNFEN